MSPKLANEAQVVAASKRLRGYDADRLLALFNNGPRFAREAARRELKRRELFGVKG